MAELRFLDVVTAFLENADLTPKPAGIGPAEPGDAASMPALVLSLEAMTRGSVGLGARAALVRGALAWRAKIDLASPVLSEEPTFTLLDDTRTILTLPHGSLVRADGTAGPLAAYDDDELQLAQGLMSTLRFAGPQDVVDFAKQNPGKIAPDVNPQLAGLGREQDLLHQGPQNLPSLKPRCLSIIQ